MTALRVGSIGSRFSSSFFRLSVTTAPPSQEAQASSNAPVTETPASIAHFVPRRIE